MKKFLKITAVIFLSLLIFFVGTFKYRQYNANRVKLPKQITSLVKINVDELYKSLAANIISNPAFYFKSDFSKRKDSKFSGFEHGLKIPASIYLYTLENQPKSAIFTRLEIKDYNDFENFLKTVTGLRIEKKAGQLKCAKSKPGNFSVYYNKQVAAIVLSNEINNYDAILADILIQKDFEEINKYKFGNLINAHKHICYEMGTTYAELNFENGKVNFLNTFNQPVGTILNSGFPHPVADKNSTVSFWLNAGFAKAENKTYKLKNVHVERDSLAKYYKNSLAFEWTNTILQTDSIITYDYNDDFEKVEKVALQKKEIPDFVVNIAADVKGLKNYLSHQNIINPDGGTLNKAAFPLYKVLVSNTDKELVLSTKQHHKTATKTAKTDDFFALNVNFIKLNKQLNQPLTTRYFKNLTQLTMSGKASNTGEIKIEGKLSMVNRDINSLFQLLNSL
ncbi:hypothetical protein [Pedobacter aquatilis]|uniref:hypothetical protein n=1 Tax=Pedobacter aquatilis TaxID=351343 RepID=UPI0029300AF6|nr:hypothetical protein [Pedobacter aquatilis]